MTTEVRHLSLLFLLAGCLAPLPAQLSISAQTVQAGATVLTPIVFSPGDAPVSALQFDLIYPSAISLSIPEDALAAADKTLYQGDVGSNRKRFLIAGLNMTPISGGALLQISVNLAPAVDPGDLTLQFANVVASGPDGTAVAIAGVDGVMTVPSDQTGAPSISAVLNGASQLGGPVAPGEFVKLVGTGLRPSAAGPLSDTAVSVNGFPAPILNAGSTQINAIIPYGIVGQASATLTVTYQGSFVTQTVVPVSSSAPGIFSVDASGVNQGLILNQSSVQNSKTFPAEPDTTIMIFATGAGRMTPDVADGQILSGSSLPVPVLPVAVTIGGIDASVSASGAAPNMLAGILQVKCRIPKTVASGPAVPVVLAIGDAVSQSGLTMAIK